MQWLASILPQPDRSDQMVPSPDLPGGDIHEETFKFHFPPWLGEVLKTIWLVLVIGLFVLAIWRISSQIFEWMRRRVAGSGGESESLKVDFWADWLNWYKNLFNRIFRFRRGGGPSQKEEVSSEKTFVRQIYVQWLRHMASAGFARQKAQTPLEYQNGVEELLRPQKEAVVSLTDEYMRVRYGAAAPSVQDLENVQAHWAKLKKTDLKQRKRNKNKRE
jgi:hypothetical protein